MAPRKTIAGLSAELERTQRHNRALEEWFFCEKKPEAGTFSYTLLIEDQPALRVDVRGCTRAAGGVAVMSYIDDSYRDLPRFLDDIIAEWTHDCSPYTRSGATDLARMREQHF